MVDQAILCVQQTGW